MTRKSNAETFSKRQQSLRKRRSLFEQLEDRRVLAAISGLAGDVIAVQLPAEYDGVGDQPPALNDPNSGDLILPSELGLAPLEQSKTFFVAPKNESGTITIDLTIDNLPESIEIEVQSGFSIDAPNAVTFGTQPLDALRVQQRLRSLDFPGSDGSELDLTAAFDNQTRHAIGIFNSAVTGEPFAPVDAIRRDLINSSDAPRWVELDPQLINVASDGLYVLPNLDGSDQTERFVSSRWLQTAAIESSLISLLADTGQADVDIGHQHRLELRRASLPSGGPVSGNELAGDHHGGLELDFETPSTNTSLSPFFAFQTIGSNRYVSGSFGNLIFLDAGNYVEAAEGTYPLSQAVQVEITDDPGGPLSAWNNRDVLFQIRDFLQDNSTVGYDVNRVRTQFQTLLNAGVQGQPPSFVDSITYNDPRTWLSDDGSSWSGDGITGPVRFGQANNGVFQVNLVPFFESDQIDASSATLLTDGLSELESTFESLSGSPAFSTPVPFLQKSHGELLPLVASLKTAIADPLESYFASAVNPHTSEIVDLFQTISGVTDGVVISVDPSSVTGGRYLHSDGDELRFALTVTASQTQQDVPIDFGPGWSESNLHLPDPVAIDLKSDVTLDLSFGVALSTESGFFFDINRLDTSITSSNHNLDFDLNVGVLGTQVTGGSVELDTRINVATEDAFWDSRGRVSGGTLQQGLTNDELFHFQTETLAEAQLPVSAALGNFTTDGTSPHLSVLEEDAFDGLEPSISYSEFSEIIDFRNLTATEVQQMLSSSVDWLTQWDHLFETPQEVPFGLQLTTENLFDAPGALQEAIEAKLTSQGKPSFATLQELVELLGTEVIDYQYEIASGEFSIDFEFESIADVFTHPLDLVTLYNDPIAGQPFPDHLQLPLIHPETQNDADFVAKNQFEFSFAIDVPGAAGPTLPSHYFVDDSRVAEIVAVDAESIDMAGQYGFLDTLSNHGDGQSLFALELMGLEGRYQVDEMPASVTAEVGGSAAFQFRDFRPADNSFVVDGDDTAYFTWTDLGDYATRDLDVPAEFLCYQHVGYTDIVESLRAASDYINSSVGLLPANGKIPLINANFSEVHQFAKNFSAAVTDLENLPAQSIGKAEARIEETLAEYLNIPLSDFEVDLLLSCEQIQIDIHINDELLNQVDEVSVDLAGYSLLGGESNTVATLVTDLSLGVDLSNPSNPRSYIGEATQMELQLRSHADDLIGEADLGPLSITIGEGTSKGVIAVDADGLGPSTEPATFGFYVEGQTGAKYYAPTYAANEIEFDHVGEAGTDLPLFYWDVLSETMEPLGGVGEDDGSDPDDDTDEYPENHVVYVQTDLLNPSTITLVESPEFESLFTGFSLLDALGKGIEKLLGLFGETLGDEWSSFDVPLVGKGLALGSGFTSELKSSLNNAVDSATSGLTSEVQQALYDGFVAAGLSVGDISGPEGTPDGASDPHDVVADSSADHIQFEVELTKSTSAFATNLPFDIGVPALGFDIDGNVPLDTGLGFSWNLGFGVSKQKGFYLTHGKTPEFVADFGIGIPDAEIEAQFGFLSLTVEDNDASPSHLGLQTSLDIVDPTPGDNRITLSELGNSNAWDFDYDGGVNLNLHLESSIDDEYFPGFQTDFVLEYPIISSDDIDSELDIRFENAAIDLGGLVTTVLAPLLESAGELLSPFDQLFDVILEPIPVLSDFSAFAGAIGCDGVGDTVEIADAIDCFSSESDWLVLLNIATKVEQLTRQIEAGSGTLLYDLGGFNVTELMDPRRESFDIEQALDALDSIDFSSALGALNPTGTSAQTKEILQQSLGTANLGARGLYYPILENPSSAFGLLFNQDVPLVGFDLPQIEGSGALPGGQFRVFDNFEIDMSGDFQVAFDVDLFYDTKGLTDLIDSGNVADLLNGIYLTDFDSQGNDTPEAELGFDYQITGGYGAGFPNIVDLFDASATGRIHTVDQAGAESTLKFELRDFDDDGKVRYNEMSNLIGIAGGNPAGLFDLSGKLEGSLNASVWAGYKTSIFAGYETTEQCLGGFCEDVIDFSRPRYRTIEKTFYENEWELANTVILDLYDLNVGGLENAPTLAELDNGTLWLNVGDRASMRSAEAVDSGESYQIKQTATEVIVEAFGLSQSFAVADVSLIRGDFGLGEDTLAVDQSVTIAGDFSGGVEADSLTYHGTGNVILRGDAGDDRLQGGDGNDTIHGGTGADVIRGGAGNDTIKGEAGDDGISGGSGDDVIEGGTGNDRIAGDAGQDTLQGESGRDQISGGSGNDIIRGGENDDRLFGNSGVDTINGDDGNDTIDGGEDADIVRGDLGDDDLIGGTGDGADLIEGGEGNDTARGGAGDDTIRGGEGNDTLFGEEGDDRLEGQAGDDHLFGEQDNDELFGGADDDLLAGGDGNDTIEGSSGSDIADGGDGDDVLRGGDQADVLFGGDGNDQVFGDAGDDRLGGGDGDDVIEGGDGADDIDGGRDQDHLSGNAGSDNISGGSGNDSIFGGQGQDFVYGSLGDDFIDGGSGDDRLDGDQGDDTIRGGIGQDTLIGDLGNDDLDGGNDQDYLIGGHGNDLLLGGLGNDRLFGNDGKDEIRGNEGNDEIDGGDDDDRIFGGPDQDTIQGGAGADQIDGGTENDTIHGGLGNDLIQGNGGADQLFGEVGDDWIDGGNDNDQIEGGFGNDTALGGKGDDTISGDAGNDDLHGGPGADNIAGGLGDDFIDGGEGVDTIRGDEGDDTLRAGSGVGDTLLGGIGNDTIIGSDFGSDSDPDFSDAIRFGDYIDGGSGDDVIRSFGGADHILAGDGDDHVDSGGGADFILGGFGNDTITVGAGTGDEADGQDGEDLIHGSVFGADLLRGGLGDDQLFGYGGDDQLFGGPGNDLIDGGAGTDVVSGETGNDELLGGGGVGDQLRGGEGNDVLRGSDDGADIASGGPGKDAIYGYTGNDVLRGDEGDDQIFGGDGDDLIEGGPGMDTILGESHHDQLYGHTVDGTGDDGAVDYLYGDFGIGTVTISPAVNRGTPGDDQLFGGGGNDLLFGEEGDDAIDVGSSTGDTVNFGPGEAVDPFAFVPPTPTPDPSVQAAAIHSSHTATLPTGLTEAGLWHGVDGSASAVGVSGDGGVATEPSIATYQDTRYIAWADDRSGVFQIYVAKHDTANGWTELNGSAGLAGISGSDASSTEPSIAIDALGRPMVAWTDRVGDVSTVHVRIWDDSSQTWSPLSASDDATASNGNRASESQLISTPSGPVVIYVDASLGIRDLTALRYDGSSQTWAGLDGSENGFGLCLTDGVIDFSVTRAGDDIALAMSRSHADGSQVHVKEFSAGTWTDVSPSTSDGVSEAEVAATEANIAYHDSVLYVAWTDHLDGEDFGSEIFVRRYIDDRWEDAGTGAASERGFSGQQRMTIGHARSPVLLSNGSVLTLSWADQSLSSPIEKILSSKWSDDSFAISDASVWNSGGRGDGDTIGSINGVVDSSDQLWLSWSRSLEDSGVVQVVAEGVSASQTYIADQPTSLADILAAEDLGPGDRIVVKANQTGAVTIGAADSGIQIIGNGEVRILGNVNLIDADDVTLQGLHFEAGLLANNASQLTLRDSSIAGSAIQFEDVDDLTFLRNDVSSTIEFSGQNQTATLESNSLRRVVRVDDTMTGATFANNSFSQGILVATGSQVAGEFSSNVVVGTLDLAGTWTGPITENRFHSSNVGVRFTPGPELFNNRIDGNEVGVIAEGMFGEHGANQIFNNMLGVRLENATVVDQTLARNAVAVEGDGNLGLIGQGNLIADSEQFSQVTGSIVANEFRRDGVISNDRQQIQNNLLTDSQIDVKTTFATKIYNNTLLNSEVSIRDSAAETEVIGNLFASGSNLSVEPGSHHGFFSDYNVLHTIDYRGESFDDVLDWKVDIREHDAHSFGTTRVSPDGVEPIHAIAGPVEQRQISSSANQRRTSPSVDSGSPLLSGANGSELVGAELLINPGFESGLDDWTPSPALGVAVQSQAAYGGLQSARIPTSNSGTLSQVVDLVASGVDLNAIDSGALDVIGSGRVRLAAGQSAQTTFRIELEFRAADQSVIDTIIIDTDAGSDRWHLAGDRVRVPSLTRRIEYRIVSDGAAPSGQAEWIDDTSLVVIEDRLSPDIGSASGTQTDAPAQPQGPRVYLRSPDLYLDWERDTPKVIQWETFDVPDNEPIRIELMQDTGDGPALLATLASTTVNDGMFTWTPAASSIDYGTHGLSLQLSLANDPIVFDRSLEAFSVPEDGSLYFVNDDSQVRDEYTSAIGDHRNTGRLASAPKPSLGSVIDTYAVSAGDVVTIDTGDFASYRPMVIANQPGVGDDEGFSLRGAQTGTTTLRQVFSDTSAPVLELVDADVMVVSDLTFEGGTYGIYADEASEDGQFSRLTVTANTLDGVHLAGTENQFLTEVEATGNGRHGIWIQGDIGEVSSIVASGNADDGVKIDGSVTEVTNSLLHDNGGSGLSLFRPGSTVIQANEIYRNARHGIQTSVGHGVLIGSADLIASLGNRVYENGGVGITSSGRIEGNTVFGHPSDAGIVGGGVISRNVVYGNRTGIRSGPGVVKHNRVYETSTGITLNGAGTEATENVVYSSTTGIVAADSGSVTNNLVYDTRGYAITGGRSAVIRNNTLAPATGHPAVLVSTSSDILNNIFVVTDAHAIGSANATTGTSDYNLFDLSGDASIGIWDDVVQGTLNQWNLISGHDQNSVVTDALFVDPAGADGVIGASGASKGIDDDFHLRSPHGSFHGGTFAPVIDEVTGLPVLTTATLTNDTELSPGIDRGDLAIGVGDEPENNGGVINVGAFGGTLLASKSPEEYLIVTQPNSPATLPIGQTFDIQWRTSQSGGTVDVELVPVAGGDATLIADDISNNGMLSYQVDAAVPLGEYIIRVSASDSPVGNSVGIVTIAAETTNFYVNLAVDVDLTDNQYTTAAGDENADGLTPATPSDSIQRILDSYDLGPGDTILVDTGEYLVDSDIVIVAEDSGITISGPTEEDKTAVINRGGSGTAFYLNGIGNAILTELAITNAHQGVRILGSQFGGASGIRISSSEIYGHITGIEVSSSVSGTTIENNVIRNNALYGIYHDAGGETTIRGNEIFSNAHGMNMRCRASHLELMIEQNTIRSNYNWGLTACGSETIVQNNAIYGHQRTVHPEGFGLEITDGIAQGNEVYDNRIGITGHGDVLRNHVHDNFTGVDLDGGGTISGNVVQGNTHGVLARNATIESNLIYDNQDVAVSTERENHLIGNTIVHSDTVAVSFEANSSTQLRNNIISVDSATAISIDATSQLTFDSDYNLFEINGTGILAQWGERSFTDLSEWSLIYGLDNNSQIGDPGFVDTEQNDFHLVSGSAGIDRGDPASPFAHEPAPNGSRVNLGIYGNTPEATRSFSQTLQILSPVGTLRWEAGFTEQVRFRSDGLPADAFASIDVSIDSGTSWTEIASDVELDAAGAGQFDWLVPADFATASASAMIRVRSSDIDDISTAFMIAPAGNEYFINIAGDSDLTDNQYTSAAGDNRNSGKRPDAPMTSFGALLNAYEIVAGDVIYVDTGTYSIGDDIRLSAANSGVTITGPTDVDKTAILDRGNRNSGADLFELRGVSDVTFSHLTIMGAYHGVALVQNTGNSNITIRDSTLAGNTWGVRAFSGNNEIAIYDNEVRNNSNGISVQATSASVENNRVFANGYGIAASDLPGESGVTTQTIIGNEVYSNSTYGVQVEGYGTLATENVVYGNRQSGVYVGNGARAIDNEVYENVTGFYLQDDSVIGNNRIYANTFGIWSDDTIFSNFSELSAEIVDNSIYSNRYGIYLNDRSFHHPIIASNRIYANSLRAIEIEQWRGDRSPFGTISNNTIHHTGSAAIAIANAIDISIVNNVFSVEDGVVLEVSGTDFQTFESDYNLFDLGDSASFAQWSGANVATLSDWQAEFGFDASSLKSDPLFADMDGADNQLGISAIPVQIVDNGDPGFDRDGEWTVHTEEGFDGDYLIGRDGGSNVARWTFDDLTPGKLYRLAVNFVPYALVSAIYDVSDNSDLLGRVSYWQRDLGTESVFNSTMRHLDADGFTWTRLGVYRPSGTSLNVSMRAGYFQGYSWAATADAMRIDEVVADSDNDDNFHLQPASPAIDRADPTAEFSQEPTPNGGRRNLGAYGNTDQATHSNAQAIRVNSPIGGEKWIAGVTYPIQFDSAGLTETVSIDVSIDEGVTWTEIANEIAVDASGLGSFDWTIPEAFVTPENTALIRARSGAGLGLSPGSFQITPPRDGTETPFYINLADDSDFSDNQYTTAIGNNRNSARSPDRPMASLAALLGAYDLEPGDIIYVDSGTHSLISNIRIGANDSGVTITGPTEIDKSAVINRGNNSDGAAVFEILGATDVTISNFGIRGAYAGIRIPTNTRSSGIVIEDNDIFANRYAGIEARPGNTNITIRRNEIHDNSTHGVFAHAEDMLVQSNRLLSNRYGVHADNVVEVRDNDVIANTEFGIYLASSEAVAAGNRVWGHDVGSSTQWEGGVGIYIDSSGTAIDNVVYDNGTGIVGEDRALIQSNRIFGNATGVRIPYGRGVQIVGNTVYSNSRGILVTNSAEILTNLIYANTNSAVSLEGFSCTVGSCLVAGNTIHQATGDAVSIVKSTFGRDSYNARIYNNVISVDNGAAIAVQTGSADGFRSDNNLIQLGAGSSAVYGEYEGAVATDLAAWQAETGQSPNSIEGDPLFIDPNGIDNLLGYVDGVDYGRDDNWALAKGSPAIDAGNALATTPSDYLESARRDDSGTLNSGSADHLESPIEASNYSATGVSLGLRSSGFVRTPYTLPFAFPLFGANLTNVEISNQGLLQFHNNSWMQWSADAEARLKNEPRYRITALWQDIHTAGPGDGVFVDDSIADQVTFHWNATSSSDAADVRFGVTLHSSGDFEFHYGATGGLPALAGYARPSWLLMSRTAASNGLSTQLDDTTIRFAAGPGFADIGALEFRGDSNDVLPPFIASASPAAISVGGNTNDTIDSFEVIFNEEVNFFDASSFAAYDLREAGLNGTFGDGDDTVYEITPEFNLGDSSVNLLLDPNVLQSIPIGGSTSSAARMAARGTGNDLEYYLPEGNYRFELKSDPTGGIRDTAGLSIDGNGDNTPGGSFVQDFQVHFTPEYLTLDVTPSILEGETATITGTFRDLSDGNSYTLLVDWGDGTLVQSFPIPDGDSDFSFTHFYVNDSLAEAGGQFQVTTTLANDLGRQTLNVDRPLAVTVDNLAPTIDSLQVPAAVNEGETFSISGTFTELGTDDELVLSVDWGHGPVEDIPLPTGSSNFVIEHTYTNIASRVAPIDEVISVTLSDGSAASDAMVNNVQLTTLNAPPQINDETFEVTEHPADETIVGQVVNSDPDLTAPNQDTQTFEIVGGSGFGIYEIDPSGVIRVATGEAVDYESTASHSLFVQVTDGRGETDLALVNIDLQNVTEIESIIIDNGSNQRSMVRSIEVNFDASVTLDRGAIEIETDSGEMLVPMVQTRLDQGRTIATLTFSGGDVDAAGSLIDGNYRLRIDRQKVTPTSAAAMRDDHIDSFFRFFGDTDGDRDVDGQDYGRFGLTFLKSIGDAGFDERFDSDGDGDVDGQDYGRFGLRFLRSLPS